MSDVKPGEYAFSKPGVHYVCGRAYSGSMTITETTARDPYVERLVASGALKYKNAGPGPQARTPQLIDRSAPQPESAPSQAPEPEPDRPFRHSKKNRDK